ncbi:hypothetical protein Tco_1065157, partial [Tanacetum coccineum]
FYWLSHGKNLPADQLPRSQLKDCQQQTPDVEGMLPHATDVVAAIFRDSNNICRNHMMADTVGVNSNDAAPAYQRQKKQF